MIGFIGGGNMAEALIKGLKISKPKVAVEMLVSEPRPERRQYLELTYGVKTTSDNKELASSAEIIILAVKPQNMEEVLSEINQFITEEKTVVSIAAGITLSYLQSKLKTSKLIRVMPNTPALVMEGVSVISLCSCLPMSIVAPVRDIFMSVGKVLTLPEKYMDAVTALSGSGPAFIAFFVESLIAAGEKIGLGGDNASELAIQTFIGTSRLIESGVPPKRLREMVTSPGGTTAAGLKTFEEKGFEKIIYDALQSALSRAEELGRRR
jgi:pyrroline-5-carboxylate reductase